ncbi:unnamed protein product [Parnassius apollo]|uniref:(apollo) hypothetical protein n=1 Tax=Parnassius apollo TaxID=110799 RepID=A0A8S3XVX6_PARAO|nr:unnamed protein product [Parnassius apollo]
MDTLRGSLVAYGKLRAPGAAAAGAAHWAAAARWWRCRTRRPAADGHRRRAQRRAGPHAHRRHRRYCTTSACYPTGDGG